jgi:hypothetical protein
MCAQCMASAAAAVGGASGLRAWLGTRTSAWLTPKRLKWLTRTLGAVAILASATLAGSSA